MGSHASRQQRTCRYDHESADRNRREDRPALSGGPAERRHCRVYRGLALRVFGPISKSHSADPRDGARSTRFFRPSTVAAHHPASTAAEGPTTCEKTEDDPLTAVINRKHRSPHRGYDVLPDVPANWGRSRSQRSLRWNTKKHDRELARDVWFDVSPSRGFGNRPLPDGVNTWRKSQSLDMSYH